MLSKQTRCRGDGGQCACEHRSASTWVFSKWRWELWESQAGKPAWRLSTGSRILGVCSTRSPLFAPCFWSRGGEEPDHKKNVFHRLLFVFYINRSGTDGMDGILWGCCWRRGVLEWEREGKDQLFFFFLPPFSAR